MTGNLILNTSSPTSDLQAASKGYVDNITGSVIEILDDGTQAHTSQVQISGLENAKFIFGSLWSKDIYTAEIVLKSGQSLSILETYNDGGQYEPIFCCIFNNKCASSWWSQGYSNVKSFQGTNLLPSNTIKITSKNTNMPTFNLLLFKLK